jgi:predicted lactoylglutathione lyase
MIKQIFVNLPIKNLEKTMAFWQAMGFKFNPQFTDEKAGALELGENIFAMLLTEPFFKTFTNKEVADSSKSVEVLNAISVESREVLNELMQKGLAAGGKEPRPAQDHGWMLSRALEDVDGHTWEITHMDLSKLS